MMLENPLDEYRLSPRGRRYGARSRLAGSSGASAIALVLPLTRRAARRAETRHFLPLTAIRRIFAAIRLWRARARTRQELRELSDHMLKDIGLCREEVGYQFAKPFSHWD